MVLSESGSATSIAEEEPTEAPAAVSIGTTGIVICFLLIVFIIIMDIGTVQRRPLATQAESMTFAPRFAPDGQTVVFSRVAGGNTDIYTMNLANGRQQRLTSDDDRAVEEDGAGLRDAIGIGILEHEDLTVL